MSKYSVRKPFTVLVMVVIILILGFMSFSKMRADLLPSINLPYMIITTSYVGASPEKVEKNVTIPLEKALASATNVKNVTSVSNENISIIMLEFEDGTNMDSTLIEINNNINTVKSTWNDSKIATPNIIKINPNMLPVMIAAVDVEDMEISKLSDFINNDIVPELQKVPGVANITVTGAINEKIYINLNQEKIDSLNEKIFNNIDEEIDKTKSDLLIAKNEIQKGKKKLNETKLEQTEQLKTGLEQITNGEQELINAINTLEEKENQLKNTSNLLNLALNILDRIPEIKNPLTEKIEEDIKQKLSDVIIKIQQLFPEIDLNLGLDLKQRLKDHLTEIEQGLIQISNAKNDLNIQKTSLLQKEIELENARNTLEIEMNNALVNLNSREAQVNQGLAGLDEAKENAYKNASLDGIITQNMISGILTAENFSMPAGYIGEQEDKIILKVGDEFKSLDEIENLKLMHIDNEEIGDVLLKDVADISIKDDSDTVYAKVNGNNGVLLSFQKLSTESTGFVSDGINEKFLQLEDEYSDLSFSALMDQGQYIDIVITSVLQNLLYGAILAIFVLLIFLRDIKPTIAIALSIPISLTFAITLMYFTGVSINIISLSGLALSVGMLVDNAIVVIENIYRLKSEGMPIKNASIEGARSVASAIFASTLTTICVFFPIVFVEGMTRDLFTDIALTIAYSLLASLLVALTVIPALTSKIFNNNKSQETKTNAKILEKYEYIIKVALSHKIIILVSALVLFIGSIALVSNMGTAFIPEIEGTQMTVTLNFNKEVSQKEGNDISNEFMKRLLKIKDIETIGAMRSNVGLMGNSNSISMYLILNKNRSLNNVEMEKAINSKAKGLNCDISVQTSTMDMSVLGGNGIEIVVKGNDLYKLQEIAKDLEEKIEDIEGISTIDNGISDTINELMIRVDKGKAIEYGLTVAGVYSTLAEKVTTEKDSTTVSIDNKDYSVVVVKSDKDIVNRESIEDIELENQSNSDETVVISEISTIETQDSMNSINRENSQRYIKLNIQVDSEHNIGLVSRDVEKVLDNYDVPNGYSIEIQGESITINKSLSDLLLMVILAVVLIYLIMVAQFQSLKLPFIIMFTIPLAFTGGLFALIITGKELSVISMIGFLILAGIIVNNGIVLIDYINQLRKNGKEKNDAIIEAGKTRLRPILMTAITTILGMSTMALGLGMGSGMVQPLGIVVIGGMIYATILTLIVVPCMYAIIERKE